MAAWDKYLGDEDRETVARGGWARLGGFGERPAVLVIDAQNYMVGERDANDPETYPLSCGQAGWQSLDHIRAHIETARAAGVPVIYTRFALDLARGEGGGFTRKLCPPPSDYIFIEGTHGSRIVDEITPRADEIVITKKKSSAFFGTPLQAYLTDSGIDTVIVTGGSTSNCVRNTVTDAAAHNYRVIVPEEAVFDRLPLSHHVTLFDIHRTFGDVVASADVLRYLESRG